MNRRLLITGEKFRTRLAPLGLFILGVVCDGAQSSNHGSVALNGGGGEARPRRLIHERHEFVREARHGATDANAADVGTTSDTGHPSALGHVTIHYRAPAADLDQTFRFAVLVREHAFFVIAGAIAAMVDRRAEKPFGTQRSSSGIKGARPAA